MYIVTILGGIFSFFYRISCFSSLEEILYSEYDYRQLVIAQNAIDRYVSWLCLWEWSLSKPFLFFSVQQHHFIKSFTITLKLFAVFTINELFFCLQHQLVSTEALLLTSTVCVIALLCSLCCFAKRSLRSSNTQVNHALNVKHPVWNIDHNLSPNLNDRQRLKLVNEKCVFGTDVDRIFSSWC